MELFEPILHFFEQRWVHNIIWAGILAIGTAIATKVVSKTLRHLLNRDDNPLPASSIFINIARAVKRGAGAEDGAANYEDIVYEGYAPAGVGLIIECLTDNRNRAAAEVRSTLTKGNGSLATSGSVSFNFERKGQIVVPSEGVDFDKLFETAAEAGAEDVTDDGEVFTVVTGPSDLFTVRKALQEAGFDYDSADQVMQPKNEVELSLEDARKVSKLIDNLDDLDDVQNIYSNWTASDEVMAQLDEE